MAMQIKIFTTHLLSTAHWTNFEQQYAEAVREMETDINDFLSLQAQNSKHLRTEFLQSGTENNFQLTAVVTYS